MEPLDKYESIPSWGEQQTNMRVFTGWVLMSQVFGLSAVILVAVWMGHFQGGFAWQENPEKEFNYHPLFMVIGMVFLYGDAILVYRVFRNEKKVYVKILHAALQVFALLFAGVGLKAVFDSHNLKAEPLPNMYTLHSWLGIGTVALFGLQWLIGLVTFLVPGLSASIRAVYKPVHVYWGIAIFALAIGTALTGIMERAAFHVVDYNKYSSEGFLVNSLGLILVAMGITVVYIVTKDNFKRQPLPEEDQIMLHE